MIDVGEYEQLARESGAYKDIELDILREALLAWEKTPGEPYTLLELRDGKVLAGFAIVARTPNTDYSFDVRAICIEGAYAGKGVSQRLLEMLEGEIEGQGGQAILRFELSSRKVDALGDGLFNQAGYVLLGHIEDFYSEGDDYYMYAKHLDAREAQAGDSPLAMNRGAAPSKAEGGST
jgi:ribosomal protein S18 acetylase RimI-like enzyme